MLNHRASFLIRGKMAKSTYWDSPHARIYASWMLLPSWRKLSCFARSLIVELITTHRPTSENLITLSDRQAATLLNCSRPTATKAIAMLEQFGWIEVERVGKIKGRRDKRTNAYSLTLYPKIAGDPASKAFLQYRSHNPTVKNIAINGQNQSQQRLKMLPVEKIENQKVPTLTH
jgi:hypothetical protein